MHWGNSPIYFPYEPGEPICAAALLAALEARRQIPAARRRHTPLFCDGHGLPFHHGPLDALLRGLLLATGITAEETMKYSWHSFRVYLATALLAVNTPTETIQALLRWKTAEACAIYARMDAQQYGAHLSRAVQASFDTIRTAHWAVAERIACGVDQQAAELERGVERMYVDARACDAGEDAEPGDAEF